MQPTTQPIISRETFLNDRRQPSLRWSAVFAGTACSVGFWMLLQFLGVGIGLAAINVDDVGSLRGASVGTTIWTLVSPLIAMFFGGLIAGKLSQSFDRKLAGAHGLVMWALTSVLGLCATIWMISMIAGGAARSGAAFDATRNRMSWTSDQYVPGMMLSEMGIDASTLLPPINQQLSAQDKPTITAAQLEAAMRGVIRSGIARGDFDQELLVEQLVATTRLTPADAIEVERQIEARVPGLTQPHGVEHRAERYVLGAADAAGKGLTTVGFSLLLSLIASVLGAMAGLRRPQEAGRGGTGRGAYETDPGYAPPVAPGSTSARYPSPVAPPVDLE